MKKIFLLLTILFIPLIVLSLLIGDVDGDGNVGSSDYILIRKHLLNISPLTDDFQIRADVNNDGLITSADYIEVRKKIINNERIEVSPTPTATETQKPTQPPTKAPTQAPTQPPTQAPTQAPTQPPTKAPTQAPTQAPTKAPTQPPTKAPTQAPTKAPTQAPTQPPTQAPTKTPAPTTTITKTKIKSIEFNYIPKQVLKIDEKVKLYPTILPASAANETLKYESSNSNCISVSNDGVVTAKSQGTATITIKSTDGSVKKTLSFAVNPKTGLVEGSGNIWGYSKPQDKVPVRADINFFKNLESKGKGSIKDNTYTYTVSGKTYVYNISRSILRINNGSSILMRIYYPQGVDLSTVNTFTFMGGSGETDFRNYFNELDEDTSAMKSSGIIILVSAYEDYDANSAMKATDFVRSIVNQNSHARNTIGGYSLSGKTAEQAANDGIYDRLIIFNSYLNNIPNNANLKNKEIVFYSVNGDHLREKTANTLNKMIASNYTNITLVTNNSNFVKDYKSNILVINPGTQMGEGHYSKYINIAKVFSFGCS